MRNACLATEFRSFPLKQPERSFFRELNDHTAIPYPLKEPVTQPWHKVFLLVQANLLQQGWPNKISAAARKTLFQENGCIQGLLDKVLRCIIDIYGERLNGRGVGVALDVLRSIKAGVWEGASSDLLQVAGIGPAKMQKLADAGIKNIRSLSKLEFYHIERLLSRNPPFGQQMLHQLASFPDLTVSLDILRQHKPPLTLTSALSTPSHDGVLEPALHHVWIARLLLSYQNEKLPVWKTRHPWVTLVIEGEDGRLVWFWRGSIKRLTDGKEMVIAVNARPGETIKLAVACEDVVGTMKRSSFKIG